MAMLEVNDIHTYYGNIHALKGISLTVEEGEIVTLIGANGAGKTTILRTISGLLKPRQGNVVYEGEVISVADARHYPLGTLDRVVDLPLRRKPIVDTEINYTAQETPRLGVVVCIAGVVTGELREIHAALGPDSPLDVSLAGARAHYST